jgi:hypothetical protein
MTGKFGVGTTPEDCLALCAQDSECAAVTWVRSGVQSEHPWCWLKTAVSEAVPDSNCLSARKRDFATVTREGDMDRLGNDYLGFAVANTDACVTACAIDAQCVAYTYHRFGTTRRCYLKDAAGTPQSTTGRLGDFISGVKTQVVQ